MNHESVPVKFPFRRDDFTSDGLLNVALACWKRHWLQLAVMAAAFWGLGWYLPAVFIQYALVGAFGEDFVTQLSEASPRELAEQRVEQITQALGGAQHTALALVGMHVALVMVVSAALLLALGYVLDVLQDKPRTWAGELSRLRAVPAQWLAFELGHAAAGLLFVAALAVVRLAVRVLPARLALSVGGVLLGLVLAGVGYVVFGLLFVSHELALAPRSGLLSAIQNSWRISDGKRLSIANVFVLSAFIWFLGVLACGVGVFATFPIGLLYAGGLFLALKQP